MTNHKNDYQRYKEWLEGFEPPDKPKGSWVVPEDIPDFLEGESDEFKASYLRACREEGLRHQQKKEGARKHIEPTPDFGVADLKAYLDLPDEIAGIAPFAPPVIDDEVIELLGKYFREEIVQWAAHYHNLNLDHIMHDPNRRRAVKLNRRLDAFRDGDGANRGFLLLVLALAHEYTIDTEFTQFIRQDLKKEITKGTRESIRAKGIRDFAHFIEAGLAGEHDAFSDPDANLVFGKLHKEFSDDGFAIALRVAQRAGEMLGEEVEQRRRSLSEQLERIKTHAPHHVALTAKKGSLPDIVFDAFEAFSEHLHDCGIRGYRIETERFLKLGEVPVTIAMARQHKVDRKGRGKGV